jgi:glycosyltransferase involved in cell wall biosynthesis
MQEVSLCIMSRNSARFVSACLEGVFRQTTQPVEILFIDDGSTDDSHRIASSYGVRVIRHLRPKGRAAAANTGICAARSQLVACLDSECVPHTSWLSQLSAAMADTGVALSIGLAKSTKSPVPLPWITNALCRRSSVESAGYFDTTYAIGGEYHELSHRLQEAGYRTVGCPAAAVTWLAGDDFKIRASRHAAERLPRLALGLAPSVIWRTWRDHLRRTPRPTLREMSWFLYAYSGMQLPRGALATLRRGGWMPHGPAHKSENSISQTISSKLIGLYVTFRRLEIALACWMLKAFDLLRRRRWVRRYTARELISAQMRGVPWQTKHVSLSVCLMTMNQEALLPLPLGSVQGWADEVLVIDGGSSDRSIEVAKDYGARVVSHPWPGQNSLQRNFYLREAKGDWVLAIDSDEFLDGGAPDLIQGLIRLRGFSHFWLLRKWLVECGGSIAYLKDLGIYPDYQMRLFAKHPNAHYTGVIHERLHGYGCTSNWVSDVSIYHLDLIVNSRLERERKVNRYERAAPGSGYSDFYLFEDYNYVQQPIAWNTMPRNLRTLVESKRASIDCNGVRSLNRMEVRKGVDS